MTPNERTDEEIGKIRAEARDWVYQRLAFASAVIWAGITAILYATYVPYIAHPQPYIAIASVVGLPIAALPWLGFPFLTERRALRMLRTPSPAAVPHDPIGSPPGDENAIFTAGGEGAPPGPSTKP